VSIQEQQQPAPPRPRACLLLSAEGYGRGNGLRCRIRLGARPVMGLGVGPGAHVPSVIPPIQMPLHCFALFHITLAHGLACLTAPCPGPMRAYYAG
jgi:hypothetical protein